MSVITQPPPVSRPVAVPADRVWRLSVDQYEAMIRHGIVGGDDRVELLEGVLVAKMTKNAPHVTANELTRDALAAVVGPDWFVNTQQPVITANSEPEPDVSVVRGTRRQFSNRKPRAQDVGMVVEVSDSSLDEDRTLKKRIYANARIPVYWIVNLIERQVEVYTNPAGAGETADYAPRQDYAPDAQVPVTLDGREVGRIPVRDLLP